MATISKDALIAALNERKAKASKAKKVRNADLEAGSSMHYYCNLCGVETAVLPEDHEESPPQHCGECAYMVSLGWNGVEFIDYMYVSCPSCGGSGLGVYDYYMRRRRRCSRCNGRCQIKKPKPTLV